MKLHLSMLKMCVASCCNCKKTKERKDFVCAHACEITQRGEKNIYIKKIKSHNCGF